MTRARMVIVSTLLLGCAAHPHPTQSGSVVRATPPPPNPKPILDARAVASTDPCDGKDPAACFALGRSLSWNHDNVQARRVFESACDRGVTRACTALAVLIEKGLGGPKDGRAAFRFAKHACDEADGEACLVVGMMLKEGREIERDLVAARVALDVACRAGWDLACREVYPMDTHGQPTVARDGARVSIGQLDADGMTLKTVACSLDGGAISGLVGGVSIVAAFKTRRGLLDRCSRGKVTETRVRWTSERGHIAEIRADSGNASMDVCVEDALRGAPSLVHGTCTVTVVHGH